MPWKDGHILTIESSLVILEEFALHTILKYIEGIF